MIADPLATKLAKILALTDSPVDSEALAAARMANSLVRRSGLTWDSIVLGTEPGNELAVCLAYPERLTQWEREFVASVRGFRKLSGKQLTVLRRLAAKCAGDSV